MADGLSANLEAVADAADVAPAHRLPVRIARALRGRQNRYLAVAAMFQTVALCVTLLTAGTLENVFLIGAGLLLIFAALNVPRDDKAITARFVPEAAPNDSALPRPARDARRRTASNPTATTNDPLPPSPLPFIGERMLINADIDRLSRAAARLSQMTVARKHPWGELMARVSHELRTPLNAVIGFSDVMNSELLGPVGHPRYREYARHIRDCGRELLKSAEDTLAITCLLDDNTGPSIEPPMDLMSVVADAWRFYADVAERRGLKLQHAIPEGVEILMERRPMRQVLINLFAEAVVRAEDGGTIGITTAAHGELVQLEVFVRGRPDGESIGEASLSICLARALLEMQGAALVEVDDPHATWRALTMLRRATQDDFFRLPYRAGEARPEHLC